MQTNQIETPTEHMRLDELSKVLMDRKRIPAGFFVSLELWKAMEERWRQEGNGVTLGPGPETFHGIKLAIDPDMPDMEFDVAFTEDAWRKRLAELKPVPKRS